MNSERLRGMLDAANFLRWRGLDAAAGIILDEAQRRAAEPSPGAGGGEAPREGPLSAPAPGAAAPGPEQESRAMRHAASAPGHCAEAGRPPSPYSPSRVTEGNPPGGGRFARTSGQSLCLVAVDPTRAFGCAKRPRPAAAESRREPLGRSQSLLPRKVRMGDQRDGKVSLAERLGLTSNGLVVLTCPTCGAHTAGVPPVRCWACRSGEPGGARVGRQWRALGRGRPPGHPPKR